MNQDEQALWDMLVRRDCEAFSKRRWEDVEADFLPEEFMGIDAVSSFDPGDWKLNFASLEQYRNLWLEMSRDTRAKVQDDAAVSQQLQELSDLASIQISSGKAIVQKVFQGTIRLHDGNSLDVCAQSIYRCRKVNGTWKIAGFVGYLPHSVMSEASPV